MKNLFYSLCRWGFDHDINTRPEHRTA